MFWVLNHNSRNNKSAKLWAYPFVSGKIVKNCGHFSAFKHIVLKWNHCVLVAFLDNDFVLVKYFTRKNSSSVIFVISKHLDLSNDICYLTKSIIILLKTVTLLVIVKDKSSQLVYLNIMHEITNLWKFELNRSSKLRDNNERKNTLSHGVVCFQMLDFETSNSKLEVSKSNSWKITSFSKTTPLEREPLLTMFYTINLSLLDTKC